MVVVAIQAASLSPLVECAFGLEFLLSLEYPVSLALLVEGEERGSPLNHPSLISKSVTSCSVQHE